MKLETQRYLNEFMEDNFVLRKIFILIMSTIFFVMSTPLLAEDQVLKILSPSQWKDQQTLEAQNRVARITNKIKTFEMKGKKLSEIKGLDGELRMAEQNLDLVQQLTIEDYFIIYLNPLVNIKGVIEQATNVLTKAEVIELFKVLTQINATSATAQRLPVINKI